MGVVLGEVLEGLGGICCFPFFCGKGWSENLILT